MSQPEVLTRSGRVRGTWREGSAAFLGIPFAEPPVGALRFAAPVPRAPWEGVLDADRYGATPQRRTLAEVTAIPEPSIAGDSTLTVNVFTPAPGDEGARLPVLVYIHGGGFVAGSPASPWYDGAAFNRDGIVTVSVSYRLGFDGFGWIEDAPLNRGVLDWILALEWVRDNIAAFGGDPSSVTIAGQSAGGGAALALLTAPRAAGLFHRVAGISSAVSGMDVVRAQALGRRLAELGGVESTRAGLSSLDETTILDLQQRAAAPAGQSADPFAGLAQLVQGGLSWGPVVGDDLLPQPVVDAVRDGAGADKSLLLGTTDNEFNGAVAGFRQQLAAVPPENLLGLLGIDPETAALYRATHPGESADVVGQFITDHIFRTPAAAVAAARARRETPGAGTYLYRFSWRSGTDGLASHCLDVPFWFDCLDAERVEALAGAHPPQSLADEAHAALVRFIRDGDPGWPPFEQTQRTAHVFDAPSRDERDAYADAAVLLPAALA
ncbi:carboxylesterase/lipase family protein [Leifsonia sp. AG29]|uniref:carboxylesterase/lipase family protein n=1 Tax=Leifsonia sp. AG29 TaxID=2598860 RepID=UPI00131B4C31|nr:carboxylesterase family protein [Leifsonia sp. AG29]